MSDWIGNNASVISMMGCANFSRGDREPNDYYATPPKATELLLELEQFTPTIWECACGEGYISKILEQHGYKVISTDLIDRGYGKVPFDFLSDTIADSETVDIITNPPYSLGVEFLERSMEVLGDGRKLAMFLKLQFLESKKRRKVFERYPPKVIYVSTGRFACAKNGDFKTATGSAVSYAWFIWEKGFTGDPIIKWFN